MVNMKNYEEYMLLYADRELNVEEERALLAFVAQHPELEAELNAYAATRLQPDTTLVYADKDSLLKTEAAPRRLALGNWKAYAAAACVLLCAAIFAINQRNTAPKEHPVAIKETITTPVTPETPAEDIKDIVAPEKEVHSTPPVTAIAVERKDKKKEAPAQEHQPKKQNLPVQQPVQEQHIAAHPARDTVSRNIAKAIPQEVLPDPAVQEKHKPLQEPQPVVEQADRKNKFIARVLGKQPQGLEELGDALENKLTAARNISEEIKDTEVKFRFGKKEFLIVRL